MSNESSQDFILICILENYAISVGHVLSMDHVPTDAEKIPFPC